MTGDYALVGACPDIGRKRSYRCVYKFTFGFAGAVWSQENRARVQGLTRCRKEFTLFYISTCAAAVAETGDANFPSCLALVIPGSSPTDL